MSLTRLALRLAAPLPRLEAFERYLFVGPHPDDIEIGAGATVSRLAAAGKHIVFLICTDGRFGTDFAQVSGEALAQLRRQEALRSAAMLGVSDVRFLSLSDGGFYEPQALLRGIAQAVGSVQPEVLFAPDPCVRSECHADHLNVGQAVRLAACFAANPGVMAAYGAPSANVKALAFYMTARPNRFIATRGHLKRQLQAIFSCHLSQFPPNGDAARSVALYLKLRSIDLGLRSLKGRAEGFRVLGPTHMHCLPEADR
ncbi:MAG TPA: PIG-L family deacetylase [Candidatus Limiplasma stercoravium]|nr:PIG-L family deacetylase [Candidatus Limiplasma stercoravium]